VDFEDHFQLYVNRDVASFMVCLQLLDRPKVEVSCQETQAGARTGVIGVGGNSLRLPHVLCNLQWRNVRKWWIEGLRAVVVDENCLIDVATY